MCIDIKWKQVLVASLVQEKRQSLLANGAKKWCKSYVEGESSECKGSVKPERKRVKKWKAKEKVRKGNVVY